MSVSSPPIPYNDDFFAAQSGRSLASARVVLSALLASFRPASVIDVGCGVGPWLRAARELGVADVLGVDGDYVDRDALLIEPSEFLPVDLERQRLRDMAPFAEGRRFDLVISVEVAEHLSFARAESFVSDLTHLGDAVLFSAAVPFQGGEHHVNEQWPEFWALLFRARGFDCLDLVRPLVWARADVDWWYSQNLLLFVRRDSAAAAQLTPSSHPGHPPLAIVHPRNYLAQILKWFHTHRLAAAEEEEADLTALVDAYQAGAQRLPRLRAIARAEAAPERPDVFPNTRIERYFPEELLQDRQDSLDAAARELARIQARDDMLSAWLDDLRRAQTGLSDGNVALLSQNASLVTANADLAAAQARFADIHTGLQSRYADLRAEHEVLRSAHDALRDSYQTLYSANAERAEEVTALRTQAAGQEADMQALRRELETQLLESHDIFARVAADAEQRLAELQRSRDAERRLAELQRSRAARVAQHYYAFYSRPLLGLPLRLLRRAVGGSLRRVRG